MWLTAATVWIVAMAWGQSLLARLVPDFNLVTGTSTLVGLQVELLAFHGGIALAVAAPLFALRCCGLKLLVVGSE
jgi:hypothetical protein